jgi:hypothetical protein
VRPDPAGRQRGSADGAVRTPYQLRARRWRGSGIVIESSFPRLGGTARLGLVRVAEATRLKGTKSASADCGGVLDQCIQSRRSTIRGSDRLSIPRDSQPMRQPCPPLF